MFVLPRGKFSVGECGSARELLLNLLLVRLQYTWVPPIPQVQDAQRFCTGESRVSGSQDYSNTTHPDEGLIT